MTGDAQLSYEVNRFARPRASMGYDRFSGGGSGNDTSGLSWSLGAVLTPGPRTTIDIEYGRDFDDDHIQGDASFRVSPTVTISASARHDFSVTQSQISSGLGDLAVDDQGNFIDSNTGLPFDPTQTNNDLSEVNNVTRTQTYSLSMNGTRGRNTYGVSSRLREENNNLSGRKTTTMTSSASYGRTLSPHVSMNLSAEVSGTEDNTADDVVSTSVSAGLSYTLGNHLSGSANYSMQKTDTSGAGVDRMENTITARLLFTF